MVILLPLRTLEGPIPPAHAGRTLSIPPLLLRNRNGVGGRQPFGVVGGGLDEVLSVC